MCGRANRFFSIKENNRSKRKTDLETKTSFAAGKQIGVLGGRETPRFGNLGVERESGMSGSIAVLRSFHAG